MKIKHMTFVLSFLLICITTIFFLKTVFTLSQTLTPDFLVYHNAARNMLLGQSVYKGHTAFTLFAYPLVSALLFVPFAFIPYFIAQNIFLLLNAAALLLISWLIPYMIIKRHSLLFSVWVFSLSYFSFPTKFTLGMGQVNLIAYAVLLGSFLAYQKNRKVLTAVLFAVACIAKPILGFVLLFFLLQKKWRIVLSFLAFLLLGFFLTFLIDHNALNDYWYYCSHVIPDVVASKGSTIYYNQSFMSFVFRETTNQITRLVISYIGMTVVFVVGVWSVLRNKTNIHYQWSLLLSMLPILDTMSWQHHFVVLILPFSYAFFILSKQKQWFHLAFLLLSYLLVSSNIAHPELFLHFPFNSILSHTFFGAFLLFLLLVISQNHFPKTA